MYDRQQHERHLVMESILAMDTEAFLYQSTASEMPDFYVCTQGYQWWISVRTEPTSQPISEQQWECINTMRQAGVQVAIIEIEDQRTVLKRMWRMYVDLGSSAYIDNIYRAPGEMWRMHWLYEDYV